MTRGSAPDLWLLALDQSENCARSLRELLTTDELVRADAFASDTLRSHWIVARGGLRILLGRQLNIPPVKVKLSATKFGKPVLVEEPEGLHFNLTHCESHAAYLFSREFPVGIDLEDFSRGAELSDCINAFCHPDELSAFATSPPTPDFLIRLWCAKEAALKAAGTGFQIEPSAVLVSGWDAEPVTATWPSSGVENWHIDFPESPKSLCLAVAAPSQFDIPTTQVMILDPNKTPKGRAVLWQCGGMTPL